MKTPTRIPGHRRRSRGISLIEVLVATSLSLMMLAGLYSFQVAQARSFAVENTYNDSQNVTRTALDLMARELRMAAYDPSNLAIGTAPPPDCPGVKMGLLQAFTDRIQFVQDLDGNGVLLGTAENVTYDVSGTSLRRTDGLGAPVTLVSGLASGGFSLRYFNGSNPPVELIPAGSPPQLTAAQRNCVTKVRVTIAANLRNPNPRISTPIRTTAETEIAIRNRSLGNF